MIIVLNVKKKKNWIKRDTVIFNDIIGVIIMNELSHGLNLLEK